MTTISRKAVVCAILAIAFAGHAFPKDRGVMNTSTSPYVKLRNVDIDAVKWTNGFWADKFELCHKVMLPNLWGILNDREVCHAYANFRIAAGLQKGDFKGTFWHDGDFYKSLEAMAYVYAMTKDGKLAALMDEAISVIAKAQREDGYIHTPTLLGYRGQTQPYQNLHNHELYCMGHLMTAACIHYRATGKSSFLDIAKETGDHLYKVFMPRDPKLAHFGFNPSNIMGAVELYRTTGDRKYLDLAKTFVDMRGSGPRAKPGETGGTDLNQTRVPLRKETEAVGHAVTANYLYSGATDVYAETGEEALLRALERIWRNVTYQKMSVTGAVGAFRNGLSSRRDPVHEAYGREYQLPNRMAYNETCANIANAMWNWRMLAISGDAAFADVMEMVLYNSALSGIGLDGKNFFYSNVLRRWDDKSLFSQDLPTRSSYIDSFCCPPNIIRTIASVHAWAYSISDKAVWVNLYGSSVLETELSDGSKLKLTQITNYPWDGKVRITLDSPPKDEFAVMLRIPGWAKGAIVSVNGKRIGDDLAAGKYAEISRRWSVGDRIELDLPLPVQLIEAHPSVEELRNQVAVQRGPIVYCLESPDLPEGVRCSEVVIPSSIKLEPVHKEDLLGGIMVLEGKARVVRQGDWTGRLYRELLRDKPQTIPIRLIPYYAWSNRGLSEMTVWMPLDRQ